MVVGAQKIEKACEGDFGFGGADHPLACEDGTGKEAECPCGSEDLAGLIRLAVQRELPGLKGQLEAMPDPRREHPMKVYPPLVMLWLGIELFLMQPGSRRQFDLDKATGACLANLLALAGLPEGSLKRSPTAEAMDDYLQKLDPAHIVALRFWIVRELIASKRLAPCRFQGFWRLAVDATGLYTFRKRHCPHCLTRTDKGTGVTTYFHHVLEFKLVSPEGLAISLYSEFIMNSDGATKQDCEIKAFQRAAPVVKRAFPCLKFLLLCDGLYAKVTVMSLCERYGWAYSITLKENLPTLKAEAEKRLAQAKFKTIKLEGGISQELRFVEGLWHQTESGRELCHVLSCSETASKPDGSPETTRFLWLTNIRPSIAGSETLANDACRQRWKIENQGFNMQKNHGSNIQHGYGVTGHAWRNYYLLAQIAQILLQLALFTDAFHKLPSRRCLKARGSPPPLLKVFASLKNFMKRLAEAFRYYKPTWRTLQEIGMESCQLRFLFSG